MWDNFKSSSADVPAMELYRYASVLRSLTGGRGVHSEQFNRYEEMPREIEQRVIEEAKKARAGNSSPAR
jgi:elongation factor G